MSVSTKNPGSVGARTGGVWATDFSSNANTFPADHNPFDLVVSAIEVATGKHAKRSGGNWRLPCPSCGGGSYKVSISEGDNQCAMVHCFGCADTPAVLAAAGLRLADLYPPRNWPESPTERRAARKTTQEAGWRSALELLAVEASVALIASRQLAERWDLSAEDDARLTLAVERIDSAKAVLCNGR